MRNCKAINIGVLRGTMRTANESDLGEACTVHIGKHSYNARCFRCLGQVFCELPNGEIGCQYCRAIYTTRVNYV